MRSIPLVAATSVILMVATGCGDNGTGVNPPVANFTQTCTELSCTFTDQSTPGEGAVTGWAWDFGDPNSGTANNTSTLQHPVHIFTVANTYQVRLTVTDADGETNSITKPVTVTGGTGGLEPIASFDPPACTGLSCTFHSTSTDDGVIVTYAWTFGEGTAGATTADAAYTYTVAGTYTVTLTVTDDEGLTNSTSQTITVAPVAGQSCTGTSATDVTCTITLTQRSAVTITLESEDCEIGNNNVLIPPPGVRAQTVFFNVCNLVTPQDRTLVDDAGAELVFEAGTQLPIVFRRGSDPVAVAPQAQFTSTSATTWSISIDDGGNPGGPGEPDFADAILTVTAAAR